MQNQVFAEEELLRGLDAQSAHAYKLANPTQKEVTPLESLRGWPLAAGLVPLVP